MYGRQRRQQQVSAARHSIVFAYFFFVFLVLYSVFQWIRSSLSPPYKVGPVVSLVPVIGQSLNERVGSTLIAVEEKC